MNSARDGVLALGGFVLLLGIAGCGVGGVEAEDAKAAPAPSARVGGDWPMLGGTPGRNMVNTVEKGLAKTWAVKKGKVKNIKWSVQLGTAAYGGPVVAGGRIFVGTNNDKPRDPKITGDKGVVMCFRESDGKFLWQMVHDKLPQPDENDFPKQGVASTPAVDGDRVYYVSNRCEVVCLDVAGDEATQKGKVVWLHDLIKEDGVYPCYLAMSSPLVMGDLVFAVTGNGVQPNSTTIPAPDAPSFVALDKKTGKLVWKSNLPGKNILDGQWSSPVGTTIGGRTQVVFPGGDGWLYSFDAPTGKLLWKFDCNPKKSVFKLGGKGDRNFFVATPVIHDGKLYIGVGDEPDNGGGVGHLWCVDVTKEPKNEAKDLSPVGDDFDPKAAANKDSGLVWHFGGKLSPKPEGAEREVAFCRTLSTVAVYDGLVYAADLEGYAYCLDASTGKKYWDFDLQTSTWCSPYYVEGRVLVGADSGELFLFPHGKEKKDPVKIDMDQALKTPPVAAGGVLYITNGTTLFAVAPVD